MDPEKDRRTEGVGPADYRAIVEHQTDFIVRWTPDGRRTFANEAYCRYFGLDLQKALGSSCLSFLPEEEKEVLRGQIASLTPEDPVTAGEHPVLRPDGSIGWHHCTHRGLFDEEGRLTEILSVGRDVTERRETEEALKRLSEKHRLALDAAEMGTWDLDMRTDRYHGDERCARLFGVPEAESLSAEKVLEIIHPEDRRRVFSEAQIAQSPSSDGRYSVEYRVVWPDGSTHWIQARGQVSFEGEGENRRPVRFTGIVIDITERKRLELDLLSAKESAEEANRAKSQFLANMSHELRTPLTVIKASLEFLGTSISAEERERFLEMADASAERLLAVIDDLFDISRIEAGKMKLEERPFRLRECIRRAAEIFRSSAEEKGLRLRCEVDAKLPEWIYGDPVRLGQILINLVGNAVKFTSAGTVALEAVKQEGRILFSVEDTGIGIPRQKLDTLFQPFEQVDSSMTRAFGGTGLGLAISKELVEMMEGSIGVESREGEGSRFSFDIPLKEPRDFETPPPRRRPETSAEKLQLLVAEDDHEVRKLIKMLLEKRGVPVALAENGWEAVARWRRGDIGLILMDLQMPEMNGLEAARQIRELEKGLDQKTCIIALTAHVGPEDRRKCLEAGMNGFVGKPFRIEELHRAISSCPCPLELPQ